MEVRRWLAPILALYLCGSAALAAAPARAAERLLPSEQNTIDIVKRFGPAVVAVNITIKGQRLNPFEQLEESGGGSGFVIDRENRIITNYHVVGDALKANSVELKDGATMTVSFAGDGEHEYPVRVVGATLDYDLALLELKDPSKVPKGITPISLADSDRVLVGQKVIAIGNPFALQSTVTTGIVSAVEREGYSAFGMEIPFIQTDAAINPGNSGGPLLDSEGQLIGINNAILSPSGAFSGVGFAVPSNLLRDSIKPLEAGGLSGFVAAVTSPTQPRMGISSELSVSDYPEPIRTRLRLPDHGAVVTSVVKGSPADKAGLKGPEFAVTYGGQVYPAGADIILEMDGKPVDKVQEMQRIIVGKKTGDVVRLKLWRDGKTMTVKVKLVLLPPTNQQGEGRRQAE